MSTPMPVYEKPPDTRISMNVKPNDTRLSMKLRIN